MKAYEVYLFCFERIFSKPLSIPLLIFIFDFRVSSIFDGCLRTTSPTVWTLLRLYWRVKHGQLAYWSLGCCKQPVIRGSRLKKWLKSRSISLTWDGDDFGVFVDSLRFFNFKYCTNSLNQLYEIQESFIWIFKNEVIQQSFPFSRQCQNTTSCQF